MISNGSYKVSQTIGGAFLVSAANSAFDNTLISKLHTNDPSINPAAVLAVGASGLRAAFSAEEFPVIIESYMEALQITYILAIACGGMAFCVSLFGKWTSIKGKVVMGAA